MFIQTELLADFEREKQDTFAITADMTRQYKAMQVVISNYLISLLEAQYVHMIPLFFLK